jgi:DNA polymerase-3 subunit epsilon
VDAETTGLDASANALVEVATVEIVDGAIGESWSSLVRPARPIPGDATAVHGITEAMVAAAPEPATVLPELRRRCGEDPLVFHSALFDLPFLGLALRGAGLPPLLGPVIDTLGLARGLAGFDEHALGVLAAAFGIPSAPLHRASSDARTTAQLLLVLAERWERERGVRTLAELAAISQDLLRPAVRPA